MGELAGLFLGVDAAEFHLCRGIAAEAVFLDEEGDEDAVDLDDEVVGVESVEDVVVEVELLL